MSAKSAKEDKKKLAEDEKAPPDEDEEEQDESEDDEEDEESDEDEEEDEESDDDDDEEDEESDDDDEEEDEDEDDEEEDEDEEKEHKPPVRGFGQSEPDEVEDEYWWATYAVLGVLVLIGVLGFFGAFNKMFGSKAGAAATPSGTSSAVTVQRLPMPPGSGQAADDTRFGAKHILVAYQGSRRAAPEITRSKDDAKARAAEVVAKIKKGTNFDDLVKDYSDEPGAAARQGNLGRFRKGTMDPAFQAAVEKLKVGETSDVVESPFGFHVIQRTF